jgi:hypothetical protein
LGGRPRPRPLLSLSHTHTHTPPSPLPGEVWEQSSAKRHGNVITPAPSPRVRGVVQGLARSSSNSTSASLGSICRCAFPAVQLSFRTRRRPLLPGFALTPPFSPAPHQASGTAPLPLADEM